MALEQLHLSPHFDLSNTEAYQQWRNEKLSFYPVPTNELLVAINDFNLLTDVEIENILNCLNKFNMAIYSLNKPSAVSPSELCNFVARFGLYSIDGNLCSGEKNVSKITVIDAGRNKNYIPYTNKPISWHTDGYYNSLDNTIRSFILHCSQAANSGGYNNLIDPEIIYILLRDENPEYIKILMESNVLTIPENIENGVKIREQQSGPVFTIDERTGKLHMRYTARTRSIAWKDNELVTKAVAAINNILKTHSKYIFKYKLEAGQGLLCNNVLHNRTAFDDSIDNSVTSNKRELLRARYNERVQLIKN
ncbi:FIG00779168: hypothetical protein [hydrothermal vent metagenome]|uniref:TauD/TfdA-like domain-containing protein n=1 Tax=hydrothermal vent metagenome TaxID=652676 RepID=A0A3B1ASD1_9ZZZZ